MEFLKVKDLGPVSGWQWKWLRKLLSYKHESWGPIGWGEW